MTVSRIPISQAWRCLPFRTISGVSAGLAARCVTSRFACWCLATSDLWCHLSVVPGASVVPRASQVLSSSVPAVPAQGLSQGSHPQAGSGCQGFPLMCVLGFCTSLGLWGAVVWGGCCPNSQLPWAVTLWTSYCLVWAISAISAVVLAAGDSHDVAPESRVLLRIFFGQFLPGRKTPLRLQCWRGPACPA